jgi:hypothetical protein
LIVGNHPHEWGILFCIFRFQRARKRGEKKRKEEKEKKRKKMKNHQTGICQKLNPGDLPWERSFLRSNCTVFVQKLQIQNNMGGGDVFEFSPVK